MERIANRITSAARRQERNSQKLGPLRLLSKQTARSRVRKPAALRLLGIHQHEQNAAGLRAHRRRTEKWAKVIRTVNIEPE
jgi:hypothetical protein